jgi:hypothetical protein
VGCEPFLLDSACELARSPGRASSRPRHGRQDGIRLQLPGERKALEMVQVALEAAANALAPAFITREESTLVALHAAIGEFALARIIVTERLNAIR